MVVTVDRQVLASKALIAHVGGAHIAVTAVDGVMRTGAPDAGIISTEIVIIAVVRNGVASLAVVAEVICAVVTVIAHNWISSTAHDCGTFGDMAFVARAGDWLPVAARGRRTLVVCASIAIGAADVIVDASLSVNAGLVCACVVVIAVHSGLDTAHGGRIAGAGLAKVTGGASGAEAGLAAGAVASAADALLCGEGEASLHDEFVQNLREVEE